MEGDGESELMRVKIKRKIRFKIQDPDSGQLIPGGVRGCFTKSQAWMSSIGRE